MLVGQFKNIYIFVLSIGREEEDDAHPFGCATWSWLQNRLHV